MLRDVSAMKCRSRAEECWPQVILCNTPCYRSSPGPTLIMTVTTVSQLTGITQCQAHDAYCTTVECGCDGHPLRRHGEDRPIGASGSPLVANFEV